MYDDIHHIHSYENSTSFIFGHIHHMVGKTGYGVPAGGSHVHFYEGLTTFDDGHVHNYTGVTGPSIPLPYGGHFHCYRGITTIDHAHSHGFASATTNEQTSHLFARYRSS